METKEVAEGTTEATAKQAEADAAAKAAADAVAATEAKAKEDSAQKSEAAKNIPQEYKLEPLKDSLLKPEDIKGIAEYAKANKLTQEQAQAQLERENTVRSAYVEAAKAQQQAEVEAMTKQWVDEVKADKELGGENLPKTSEYCRRAIEKFGPEIKEELEKTGLGNHPGFVKFAARIGKAMESDTFEQGKLPETKKKSDADELYPTTVGVKGNE